MSRKRKHRWTHSHTHSYAHTHTHTHTHTHSETARGVSGNRERKGEAKLEVSMGRAMVIVKNTKQTEMGRERLEYGRARVR